MQHSKVPNSGADSNRRDIADVLDAIRSVVQSLRVSGRAAEQSFGISTAQLFILSELAKKPADSVNDLADRTFTHQSSVSMVVSRLVERRLVTRTAAKEDARRVSISITPAGRALVRRAPDGAQARLVDALKTMPRAHVRALASELQRLTGLMNESARGEELGAIRSREA
jgi:DNA-binding MarR family transcriptional regulator